MLIYSQKTYLKLCLFIFGVISTNTYSCNQADQIAQCVITVGGCEAAAREFGDRMDSSIARFLSGQACEAAVAEIQGQPHKFGGGDFVSLIGLLFDNETLQKIGTGISFLECVRNAQQNCRTPSQQYVQRRDEVVKQGQSGHQASRCYNGYLNGSQISDLVNGFTAYGTKTDRKVPYKWKEYQGMNGVAYFQKEGQRYVSGKWQIKDDHICWCYGTCETYQCKWVRADSSCTVYYVDTNTGNITGIVRDWVLGDKTN
ncbi:hypothetical protein TI04_05805 [Achromatium sp. WMS2]|nr:hypothetical protein TI04_05805 [Achromatium sp. WMS2]